MVKNSIIPYPQINQESFLFEEQCCVKTHWKENLLYNKRSFQPEINNETTRTTNLYTNVKIKNRIFCFR